MTDKTPRSVFDVLNLQIWHLKSQSSLLRWRAEYCLLQFIPTRGTSQRLTVSDGNLCKRFVVPFTGPVMGNSPPSHRGSVLLCRGVRTLCRQLWDAACFA